jgi:hypothetical protein
LMIQLPLWIRSHHLSFQFSHSFSKFS